MSTKATAERCHRGSYLCDEYELRITQRCLIEDLGRAADAPFSELLGQEIVRALVNRRCDGPVDTRRIEPLTSGREVYRLAYGHRHRGATWYDTGNDVVWLCAAAWHQSGAPDDAFPYFKDLDREGRLLPTEADYRSLFLDRDARFADAVIEDAQALLQRARENEGEEQRGVLGGKIGVGVVVDVVETLEETYVAIQVMNLERGWLEIVLGAFFPDAAMDRWEPVTRFPTRDLREDELCWRHLK